MPSTELHFSFDEKLQHGLKKPTVKMCLKYAIIVYCAALRELDGEELASLCFCLRGIFL